MWVLGTRHGACRRTARHLLDRLVALPIYGRAESLNLATAAAVFLYASATAQHVDRRRPSRQTPRRARTRSVRHHS